MDDVNSETAGIGSNMNLGKMISDKITESVKNVDIMGMLQKIVASTADDEESEGIRQKLQGIMKQYEVLSDGDKEQFVMQMKDVLASKLSKKLKDAPIDVSGLEDAIRGAVMSKLYLMGAIVIFIILLLVFFGYKLYKSIRDKEKKREEKKKLKQMKKKK